MYHFNSHGLTTLAAYVFDGADSDTIMWTINYPEPNGVSWLDNAPSSITLSSVYPNPFNAQTTISYSLPSASHVILEVFDLNGRRVAELVSGKVDAGRHNVVWNAANWATGIYMIRLRAGETVVSHKAVVLK